MTREECEIETSKAIMEMRNHIAELEAQIEELKRERETINPCGDWNSDVHMCQMYVTHDEIQDYCHEIEEAKSIIRDFLDCYLNGLDYSNMEKGKLLVWKATTFLTEKE